MSGDLSEHCEAGRVCAGQDKSKLPNAPFRKYQISGPDMSSLVAGWGGTCSSTKLEVNENRIEDRLCL